MLTLANVIWGARCGEPARRVLLGETRARDHAYSVRCRRESACDRKAPHRLPSSRLVSTNLPDLWAEAWRQKIARGDIIAVRFADDAVLGFQDKTEAERFWSELKERMKKFDLELHPEKTRLLEFGRYAAERRQRRGEGRPETFNFLGFTHICGKTRNGRFTVIRQTIRKRMLAKLKAIRLELRRRMHDPLQEQGQWLRAVVDGHIRYYGVPGNRHALWSFQIQVARSWHRAMCRRSQKGYVPWERMQRLLRRWMPPLRICHPYPSLRVPS